MNSPNFYSGTTHSVGFYFLPITVVAYEGNLRVPTLAIVYPGFYVIILMMIIIFIDSSDVYIVSQYFTKHYS